MGISAETKSSSHALRELLGGGTPPFCTPLALSIQLHGSNDARPHGGEGNRGYLSSRGPHQKRDNETTWAGSGLADRLPQKLPLGADKLPSHEGSCVMPLY